MVFVAKSRGKASLFFLDVAKSDVYRKERFDYYNIVNPRWSPDGSRIAFSALEGHKRDLFIYDIESGSISQITDDRFDDTYADWCPTPSGWCSLPTAPTRRIRLSTPSASPMCRWPMP
jgi:TolB protein